MKEAQRKKPVVRWIMWILALIAFPLGIFLIMRSFRDKE